MVGRRSLRPRSSKHTYNIWEGSHFLEMFALYLQGSFNQKTKQNKKNLPCCHSNKPIQTCMTFFHGPQTKMFCWVLTLLFSIQQKLVGWIYKHHKRSLLMSCNNDKHYNLYYYSLIFYFIFLYCLSLMSLDWLLQGFPFFLTSLT